jgi:hypothetical protein
MNPEDVAMSSKDRTVLDRCNTKMEGWNSLEDTSESTIILLFVFRSDRTGFIIAMKLVAPTHVCRSKYDACIVLKRN